jgi:EAL domain-containing protein (putative c-di-GMP-specific phosphodiesterase class I)
MYAAKSAGRGTCRFFEPEMDARARERLQLTTDLRQAIAHGELEVHYQPCLSLKDDTIVGCEALVRWRHPKRGMVSPAEFIPIAEDTGLIDEIGEWVLTTACRDAVTWPGDIRLAVNVSPAQFRNETLPLKIMAALSAANLPPSRLELEITEAVLVRDDEAALGILQQLRAIGVRIALDDFGTGYSSLSYLQRFPFDKIKIDQSFVKDIASSDSSLSIVQAVVNIAAARRMTTIAEGVETEEQRSLLRELGCTEMQGYLFSAAMPAGRMKDLVVEDRVRIAG